MATRRVDVVIIGSGFGGALLAMLLRRHGRSVLVVERGKHPRFAIGESSTPIADMILADLAAKYDLPRIAPLAQYGSWCRHYPGILRGRKRGFSYFRHEPGESFHPRAEHGNELLVAASSDDEWCDTHWLRADVDHFFAREAVGAGAELHEATRVEACDHVNRWSLALRGPNGPLLVDAEFLVDASGSGGFSRQWLGAGDNIRSMRTFSRSIYSHFQGVERWRGILEKNGASVADHPFPCDDAALHHVFDDAWMWVLPFDGDLVSIGLALGRKYSDLSLADPDAVWRAWLANYPSLADQLRGATLARSPGHWIVEDRLQRRANRAVGHNWAALPFAYGFIDPLHSMGIAFTLSAMERLAMMLERHWRQPTLAAELLQYERSLSSEFDMADRLIETAYATTTKFPLFVLATMLYFTAVVTYENRRKERPGGSFLCAGDADLRATIDRMCDVLVDAARRSGDPRVVEDAWKSTREAIRPFNTAGLCDERAFNMYRHTVAR